MMLFSRKCLVNMILRSDMWKKSPNWSLGNPYNKGLLLRTFSKKPITSVDHICSNQLITFLIIDYNSKNVNRQQIAIIANFCFNLKLLEWYSRSVDMDIIWSFPNMDLSTPL